MGVLLVDYSGSLDELDDLELPTQFDYIGTLYSLVRLQRVYQLDTDDLLRGQVKGYRGGPIDVAACVDLAAINEIADNEKIAKELEHHLKKTLTQALHSEDRNNEVLSINRFNATDLVFTLKYIIQ